VFALAVHTAAVAVYTPNLANACGVHVPTDLRSACRSAMERFYQVSARFLLYNNLQRPDNDPATQPCELPHMLTRTASVQICRGIRGVRTLSGR